MTLKVTYTDGTTGLFGPFGYQTIEALAIKIAGTYNVVSITVI